MSHHDHLNLGRRSVLDRDWFDSASDRHVEWINMVYGRRSTAEEDAEFVRRTMGKSQPE